MAQPIAGWSRCPGVLATECEATNGGEGARRFRSTSSVKIKNEPGALARVAAAISDAGVYLAAATCVGLADQVELHILVPHAEAAKHALAISQLAVTREDVELVVVEVEGPAGSPRRLDPKGRQGRDRPRSRVCRGTRNRLVFGAADLDGLKAALDTG